jgi:hypothetical protein
MIYSEPGSKDYRFHKYCEVEVRNMIKYIGGKAECLEWYNSIPEDGRRQTVRNSWDSWSRTSDAPYVPWNDHTYEYFQEKIGAVKPYVPVKAEDLPDAVWDDGLNFVF